MHSPQKLQARLNELLGPPGPDSDPLELMLRTVVASTAPMVEGLIGQWTPEQLDDGLEHTALYFLGIRSDNAPNSIAFLEALGKMNAEAVQAAATVDSTAAEEPPAIAAPEEPAPAPAAPAPSSPAVPPETLPHVAPDPAPADPPATAPTSPDTAPGSSTPDTPAPASSPAPDSPASSPEPSSSDTATSEPAPEHNPAPPWG